MSSVIFLYKRGKKRVKMEVKCKVGDVKRPTRLSVTGLNIIGKMLAIGKKQTSSKTTVYLNGNRHGAVVNIASSVI